MSPLGLHRCKRPAAGTHCTIQQRHLTNPAQPPSPLHPFNLYSKILQWMTLRNNCFIFQSEYHTRLTFPRAFGIFWWHWNWIKKNFYWVFRWERRIFFPASKLYIPTWIQMKQYFYTYLYVFLWYINCPETKFSWAVQFITNRELLLEGEGNLTGGNLLILNKRLSRDNAVEGSTLWLELDL